MYILLLWARYLKTRRLAFICMVSVMLGVATLIVVNGVMTGFSTKLTQKLHDMQSDIVIESTDPMVGFPTTAEDMMIRIRQSPAGPLIRAMAPSVDLFALIQFNYRGRHVTHRVRLVGVDPVLQKELPGFAEYLLQPERRNNPSFEPDEAARKRWEAAHPLLPPDPLYGVRRTPAEPITTEVPTLPPVTPREDLPLRSVDDLPPIDAPPPVLPKLHGIIVGYGLATYRQGTEDVFVMQPGDSITVLTLSAEGMQPVWDEFIVCDFIKTEMSEFDAMTVYVPLDYLQHLRTMEGRVNTLQIRLHDDRHLDEAAHILRNIFPPMDYHVATWKEKQGTLLAAISVERGILNLLLFMIIGVAGFGILAIFSMIVTEKTRDIGILKSLGASSRGVMSIFLGYGFLLGLVGALLGTGFGLLIVDNINEIEMLISRQTGAELFDRRIYYFSEIPTDIRWRHVLLVDVGAIAIAVVFSILPAFKASWLHPVRALRYE